MKPSLLSLASLVPLVAAHFKLDYPTSRGENEDTMTTFPCGGLSPSSERTKVSLSDGTLPVAVKMGHAHTAYEVLLALGNDPGTNFNITLLPTFGAQGLGSLCLPEVAFDEDVVGVKLTDGMNATLQVQSNGDPTGGLYAVCLFCLLLEFDSLRCIPWLAIMRKRVTTCTNETYIVRGYPILLQHRVRETFLLQEQHQCHGYSVLR